jgi:hypothetical protein
MNIENITTFEGVIINKISVLKDIANKIKITKVETSPLEDWDFRKDGKFYGNKLEINFHIDSKFVSKNELGEYELKIPTYDYSNSKGRYIKKIDLYIVSNNIYDNGMLDIKKIDNKDI